MAGLARALMHVTRTFAADAVDSTPPGPMMVFVEVTRRCNLRCRHCDIWKTSARDPSLIDLEMPTPLLLGVLREMVGMGLTAVDLFGGEPLIRKDLETIVQGAAELGLHVTVTTNGWKLDEPRARSLSDAGLSQLFVSLDAASAGLHDDLRGRRGAFEHATEGLRVMETVAPHVYRGIDTVITRANIDELSLLVELAAELRLGTMRFLPYHACYPFERFDGDDDPGLALEAGDVARLREVLPRVRQRLSDLDITTNAAAYLDGVIPFFEGHTRSILCGAGRLVCDINAAGDVYPCYTLERPAGNVRDASFAELWSGPAFSAHRRTLRREGCAGCWQSCYVEPALRTNPRQALREPMGLLRELRRYVLS